MIRDPREAERLRPGERVPARIGRGTPDQPFGDAGLVGHAQIATPPTHNQNAGTQRERAARAKAHAQHLVQKGRRSSPPSASATKSAPTWGLVTTAPAAEAPVQQYAARMASAQTVRDWHHGWGLCEAASALTAETAVVSGSSAWPLGCAHRARRALQSRPARSDAPRPVDGDRSSPLLLVGPPAPDRCGRRLACLARRAMGPSDHSRHRNPARGGRLTQTWPLPWGEALCHSCYGAARGADR